MSCDLKLSGHRLYHFVLLHPSLELNGVWKMLRGNSKSFIHPSLSMFFFWIKMKKIFVDANMMWGELCVSWSRIGGEKENVQAPGIFGMVNFLSSSVVVVVVVVVGLLLCAQPQCAVLSPGRSVALAFTTLLLHLSPTPPPLLLGHQQRPDRKMNHPVCSLCERSPLDDVGRERRSCEQARAAKVG